MSDSLLRSLMYASQVLKSMMISQMIQIDTGLKRIIIRNIFENGHSMSIGGFLLAPLNVDVIVTERTYKFKMDICKLSESEVV